MILALAMVLGTFATTQAKCNAYNGGIAVIIIDGKVALSLDNDDCTNGEAPREGEERQVLILDEKGDVVFDHTFSGDSLTLSGQALGQGTFTVMLSTEGCYAESQIKL